MADKSSTLLLGSLAFAATGCLLGVSLARGGRASEFARMSSRSKTASSLQPRGDRKPATTILAARRLNRAAAILAVSVLADSSVEHYRGSFKNKAMITPLAVSALTIGVSAHGTADKRPGAHLVRDSVYALAAAAGLIGTGFHIYNVGKQIGGFRLQNLFYRAPLGAPLALLLSGLVGFCSERVRDAMPSKEPTVFGLPAGRSLAGVVSAGLLGTTGEAGLMHFRGAFHNPVMILPVTLPPIGAVLLASAAAGRNGRNIWLTRWWMRFLAAMGFAGVGFHAFGISRNMGGWRNWSQNILNGPPLPAPPSFTGLALAALATLSLMDDCPDA